MARDKARSAGLLLFRERDGQLEVLLGHMGGPFWARKDDHAWSLPKGEHEHGEDALTAAYREFEEETGSPPPPGEPLELGEIKQSGGKVVTAWALAGDFDSSRLRSNNFTLEWPPRSGVMREFPELDRAGWFDADAARQKLIRGQAEFIDRLLQRLNEGR
jgi:predicted NUDIX family NTP pyrophosphohydrolase